MLRVTSICIYRTLNFWRSRQDSIMWISLRVDDIVQNELRFPSSQPEDEEAFVLLEQVTTPEFLTCL